MKCLDELVFLAGFGRELCDANYFLFCSFYHFIVLAFPNHRA
jgi:hypothetical protein